MREKEMNFESPRADFDAMLHASGSEDAQIATWDADLLADYIERTHHHYVRTAFPSILQHSLEVARRYGNAEPELVELAKIFTLITSDLQAHIVREEEVLFPYIRELARAVRNKGPFPVSSFAPIRTTLRILENEHEEADDWIRVIRELTNNYTARPDQCAVCQLLFTELADFERDLRRHLYLEDHILFPKVRDLSLETRSKGTLSFLP